MYIVQLHCTLNILHADHYTPFSNSVQCGSHSEVGQVISGLQSCYKASSNLVSRAQHENEINARLTILISKLFPHRIFYFRLLEKQERTESLVESLREGGASEEQIFEEISELMTPSEQQAVQQVKRKLQQINRAIREVSDNIFLLRLVLNIKTKSWQ